MDYRKIGTNIRLVRKAKGLSQEALAEMVNISGTHMSHIETGNTMPSTSVPMSFWAEVQNNYAPVATMLLSCFLIAMFGK